VRRGLPLLFIGLLLFPAAAQRNDLDRIRTDISRMRARLEQVRAQAQSAERDLEQVNLELEIRTNELELAAAAEAQVAAAQARTEQEIVALVPRIAQQKSALKRRLVALYRLGGLSYMRMLLELENNRSPIEAMSMLSYLVSRDARLVSRFQETQSELALRREQMAAQRQQLSQTRVVVDERRKAVIAARIEKEKVLARLRVEESGAEQQLAALEEKARRLQRLVDTERIAGRQRHPIGAGSARLAGRREGVRALRTAT
jgi:septal ring factor EnvC (AmiA/AmiB activator)